MVKSFFLKPTRSDLLSPLEQFVDNFFNDLNSELVNPSNLKNKYSYPKWDVYKTSDEYIIDVAVPGCSSENISVEVSSCEDLRVSGTTKYNRYLKISGKSSEEFSKDVKEFSYKELKRSDFSRLVYLPNELEGDPEATLKDGILKLKWKLPKTNYSKEEPKKIKVVSLDK